VLFNLLRNAHVFFVIFGSQPTFAPLLKKFAYFTGCKFLGFCQESPNTKPNNIQTDQRLMLTPLDGVDPSCDFHLSERNMIENAY